ncbi:MAG: choice-of-anchor P family protein [Acidimicrobiales bacterium]
MNSKPFTTRTSGAIAAAALVGVVLFAALPAGADTQESGPIAPGAVQLGGFDVAATAAGLSVFYNQPDFPIPATPTLEFDLGYSTSTYDSGPIATANGATMWPGSVIAGGGSQLPLLLDPYIEQYAPQLASSVEPLIPTSLNYPFQTPTAYPQGPGTATNDNGPLAMNSSSTQDAAEANSSIGIVGGAASESATPAGFLRIQAIGSQTTSSLNPNGDAVSQATSAVHDIALFGGLVTIGAVQSTATSVSDGTEAQVSGASTVVGATVAGEPVTISSTGVQVLNNNQSVLGTLAPSVNQILSTAGISMELTNPTDMVQGASAQQQLDGLVVTIDLSTYDQDFSKLESMLPSQLTSGLGQLPLPPPYKQSVTLDFGWLNVNTAGSPAFNLGLGSDLGIGATGSSTTGTVGTLGSSGLAAIPGTTGVSGVSSLPAGTSPGTTPAASSGTTLSASPTAALFKGVGLGAVLLGLLLAALLVFALWRADKAVGEMAAGAPCIGEEPADFR